MIIAQILALPFIVYRMYATRPLHVNVCFTFFNIKITIYKEKSLKKGFQIRLLLIHCFLSSGFSSICRLALLYFQYTGIPSPGSRKFVLNCSEAFSPFQSSPPLFFSHLSVENSGWEWWCQCEIHKSFVTNESRTTLTFSPFIISMERVIATQHWSWWVLIVSRLFSEIHKTAIGRVVK